MSTSVNPLSSNLQVLYNQGLLSSNVSQSALATASVPQLTKMADTDIALEVVKGLLAGAAAIASSSDNVVLSNAAETALLSADGITATGVAANEPNSVPGSVVNLIG